MHRRNGDMENKLSSSSNEWKKYCHHSPYHNSHNALQTSVPVSIPTMHHEKQYPFLNIVTENIYYVIFVMNYVNWNRNSRLQCIVGIQTSALTIFSITASNVSFFLHVWTPSKPCNVSQPAPTAIHHQPLNQSINQSINQRHSLSGYLTKWFNAKWLPRLPW